MPLWVVERGEINGNIIDHKWPSLALLGGFGHHCCGRRSHHCRSRCHGHCCGCCCGRRRSLVVAVVVAVAHVACYESYLVALEG